MYDVHYFKCEFCGAHFDDEFECRRHELNHEYKNAVSSMGRIFIKIDDCDELKEYSADYDAYDINTIFVHTPQGCAFMDDVFNDENLESPWTGAKLEYESGWYYLDVNGYWHSLEQDIAALSVKAAGLYTALHQQYPKD